MKTKRAKNTKMFPTGLVGLAVILTVASLAMSVSAFAQGPPDTDGPPHGKGMGKGGPGMGYGGGPFKGLFEILDEDQQEKVTAILEAHREEATANRDAMKAKREELHELIKADASEATIMAKAEEVGGLQTELMKSKTAMMLEIRALLTDEQKQKLDMIMDDMDPGGPGGKHGKGGGPGCSWK